MKTIYKYIDAIKADIEFMVGEHAADNHDIIDRSRPHDLWFHVSQRPSCHVIAVIPIGKKYDKKQLHKIAVQGSVLCKQYSKYASNTKINIMYTPIHYVAKTGAVGSVSVDTYKTIEI